MPDAVEAFATILDGSLCVLIGEIEEDLGRTLAEDEYQSVVADVLQKFDDDDGNKSIKAMIAPKIAHGEFQGLWPDAGLWDQRLPGDEWSRRLDLMSDIIGGVAGDGALLAIAPTLKDYEDLIKILVAAGKDYEPCRDEQGRFAPCGAGAVTSDAERSRRLDSARTLINAMKRNPPTTEQIKKLTEDLSKLTVKQLVSLKREHGLSSSARVKADLVKKLDEHLASQRAEAFHQTGLEAAAKALDGAGLTDKVKSGQPLTYEDLEKASAAVHDQWMERERARPDGVRPDRQELMKPYEKLPEDQKQKDRVYALEQIAALRPADHWGQKDLGKQPFYYPGPNPTVDAAVFRQGKDEPEILLIQRSNTTIAEPGKWALPGGFHDTDAKKGEFWRPGKETAAEAGTRELHEETGLDLGVLKDGLKQLGVYDKRGRDPRDNAEAWASSTAFAIHVPPNVDTSKVVGGDDAQKAEWVPVSQIGKRDIAFDHGQIIKDAMKLVAITPAKAFCPTGPGGGVDPTCSPGATGAAAEGGAAKSLPTDEQLKTATFTPTMKDSLHGDNIGEVTVEGKTYFFKGASDTTDFKKDVVVGELAAIAGTHSPAGRIATVPNAIREKQGILTDLIPSFQTLEKKSQADFNKLDKGSVDKQILFDYLTGSNDRNGRNYLIDGNNTLHSIDHEFAFDYRGTGGILGFGTNARGMTAANSELFKGATRRDGKFGDEYSFSKDAVKAMATKAPEMAKVLTDHGLHDAATNLLSRAKNLDRMVRNDTFTFGQLKSAVETP
jgi:ADP-ribose pyrophosphatase YjhB (NUDIX family)